MLKRWQPMATFVLACLASTISLAEKPLPTIAIIIDDMGNNLSWGRGMLEVPGQLTYAFLPHTPHAVDLAARAHQQGDEVMLHLPMQSHQNKALGPGGLTLNLSEGQFKRTVQSSLDAVPYAVGINNHMGSLMTRHPGAMAWLMESMGERGDLYFVDSRTTVKSVGYSTAQEYGIPATSRDVFLDNVRDHDAITRQFTQLIKRAYRKGYAIGIGHPYPETAKVLKRFLANPEALGIRLVPASEIIALQRRNETWPQHSSPSLKVAKNSKRSLSLTCCDEQE